MLSRRDWTLVDKMAPEWVLSRRDYTGSMGWQMFKYCGLIGRGDREEMLSRRDWTLVDKMAPEWVLSRRD